MIHNMPESIFKNLEMYSYCFMVMQFIILNGIDFNIFSLVSQFLVSTNELINLLIYLPHHFL